MLVLIHGGSFMNGSGSVGRYLADALGVPPSRDAIKQVPLDALVRAASDRVVEGQTAPDPTRWGPSR